MATRKTYWEKLKDPRWQQMRLRVMERANFRCEDCDDETTTLNVHHTYYEKGADPWEYPLESLRCLCEVCHKSAEEERATFNRLVARLSAYQVNELSGYAKALLMEAGDVEEVVAESHEELVGMVRLFSMLSHRDTGRYVSAVISKIGPDKMLNSTVLLQTIFEVDANGIVRTDQANAKKSSN